MSFGFLPWPIYILLILIAVFVCYAWVKETWKEHPKFLTVGIVLQCIGALMAGIHRLIDKTGILITYLELIRNLSIICTVPALIFFIIGAYIKVKDDPYRKKTVLLLIYVLVTILTLCGLGFAYIELYYE
jgi:hypothetical protein